MLSDNQGNALEKLLNMQEEMSGETQHRGGEQYGQNHFPHHWAK
jgi:hypothetical protein